MEQKNKTKREKKLEMRQGLNIYFSIARPYSWLFVFVVFVALFVSLARVTEKYLFKVLIDEGSAFAAGNLANSVFVKIIWIVLGVFFAALFIRTIGEWLKIHIMNRLEMSIIYDLKKRFFDHIVGLSHRFHVSHKTGSLISRMTRGARAVEVISDFFVFSIVPVFMEVAIVGASIFYFDAISASMAVLICVMFVIWSLFVLNKQKSSRISANDSEDREKAAISDVFTNIDSIKYFGKENRIKNFFARLATNTKKDFLRNWDYYKYLEGGQSFLLGIGVFLLLYFPFVKFLDGGITIGALVFIYTVYFNLVGPLFSFVFGVRRFYEAIADLHALAEYDKEKNEIEDMPNSKNIIIKDGEIEFKGVSFKYNERRIISDLSLSIKPGQKIALVGHSGSGKTTLVKLLYRLYDVDKGGIFIDGKDIRSVKQESLRGELSIVPQEAILFDDTIYNNILFSNPMADRKDVMKALKFAQLDSFVKALPKGEKTIVGERGVKLSGGEKQRVSIARAILANKKILVLDEATSSLDSQTEYEIQGALKKLMIGRTSIIIAHRLSTIMHADKIVVMDKGKVVQVGRHNDLIRRDGRYKELWDLQKGGYIGG